MSTRRVDGGEHCPSSDEQPIDLSVKQLTPPTTAATSPTNRNSSLHQSNGSIDSPYFDSSSIPLDTTSALFHPLIARTYGQLAAARYLLSNSGTSGNPIINQLIYEQVNALSPSANSLGKLFTSDETNNHYHLNDHQSIHQHSNTSPPFTTSPSPVSGLFSVNNIDHHQGASSTLASILPYLLLSNNPHLNQRVNLLKAFTCPNSLGGGGGGGNLRGSVGSRRNEKGASRKIGQSSASASHDQQVVVSPRSRDEPELRFADTTDYVGDDEDEGDEEEEVEEEEDDDVVAHGLVNCGRQRGKVSLHSSMKRTLTSGLSGGGRPLTGRYVKHGTGASEATLASLRRMLELRGRERLNGRIIPHHHSHHNHRHSQHHQEQVKRAAAAVASNNSRNSRKSNCGARRNKRK